MSSTCLSSTAQQSETPHSMTKQSLASLCGKNNPLTGVHFSIRSSTDKSNVTALSCALSNDRIATIATSKTRPVLSTQIRQETCEGEIDKQQTKKSQWRPMLTLARGALTGGFVGGTVGFVALVVLATLQGYDFWPRVFSETTGSAPLSRPIDPLSSTWYPTKAANLRNWHSVKGGIQAYLTLFESRRRPEKKQDEEGRMLTASSWKELPTMDENHSPKINHGPKLVIAGKMTVEHAPCNIAQYDLKTNEWSLTQRIQLSSSNSFSEGDVYSLLANHTSRFVDADGAGEFDTKKRVQTGSGELIVVGAFDTTYRGSNTLLSSVGKWDGVQLSKVGEGLGNAPLSKGMKITTAALAGPDRVYVAGSFQTQVWNRDRHQLVKIFNIAQFNSIEQVWSPLNVGQITCSWCTVTVLALAWDPKRRQLHVAGKFNSIDGHNVPAGLAIYDSDSGHLVAHPGGGLSMKNSTQDGVGTALQLDEESGVLYVMGSFERLTATFEECMGLAAYEIETNRWTCLASAAHTVLPTGGGNMLLTPYGLMVAGKTTRTTTWPDSDRPYTIALLKATLKTHKRKYEDENEEIVVEKQKYHDFNWSWLPGFHGHDEPLHALSNGFGSFEGTVFIAGDDLVAKWSYQPKSSGEKEKGKDADTGEDATSESSPSSTHQNRMSLTRFQSQSRNSTQLVPITELLLEDKVQGAIMAVSQMMPEPEDDEGTATTSSSSVNTTLIIVCCMSAGCIIGVIGTILFNRQLSSALFHLIQGRSADFGEGFPLDTLTNSALENSSIMDAYHRAMKTRHLEHSDLLASIDPQEIFLERIIRVGTFGNVWSAKWRKARVTVKEFVLAQAAAAGGNSMQHEIVEEIIGEARMMAMLRHPNILQLFGCSLTAQAIWIVSELCNMGSLRQLLDNRDIVLSLDQRLNLALQVAEGMAYLHNQDPPIIHRELKSYNIFLHEICAAERNNRASVWDRKRKLKTSFNNNNYSAGNGSNRMARNSNNNDEASKSNTWNATWCNFAFKLFRQSPCDEMDADFNIVAKIGDWGSRATLSGSRAMTHGFGSVRWLAPEVIKYALSSKLSDVYAYGIVLWELATREEVYQGLETAQIIAKVTNQYLRPPVPPDCPWKDVMVQCWAENPHDRLEFSEIVQQLNELLERCRTSKDQATEKTAQDE